MRQNIIHLMVHTCAGSSVLVIKLEFVNKLNRNDSQVIAYSVTDSCA